MQTPTFIPHPLVRGGHLQTVAGQLLTGARAPTEYHVETVHLPDGDRLLLHIDRPQLADTQKPLVFLMHGLGGCSESSYILRIGAKLNRAGYTVVRFNHRGCGRGAVTLARQIYHAGRVEDLAASLAHLAGRWPGHPYVVCAFSLSGNILLRYLGELGHAPPPGLRAAMAVCPPVDLEQCSLALASPINAPIGRYYTRRLVATAKLRQRLALESRPLSLPRRLNLRIFDDVYTAPRAGFSSRDEYYDRCSARHVTAAIHVPTLLLAAEDDPLIPPASLRAASYSPAVTVRIERSGGHMGFIAARRTPHGDRRWMDTAVIDWVLAASTPTPCREGFSSTF